MPVAEQVGTLTVSNDIFDSPAALRERIARDGYLYLHELGPRDAILDLRRVMLEICDAAGWVDTTNADLMEGRWSGAGPYTESEPPYMAVYKKIVNHPLFNELPAHPWYLKTMEKIVGGPVFMHRMHIGRVSFPNNTVQTTPPHQDWQYIRGTPDTYTVWTPMGDCPIEVGGLKVLRGSNRHGFIEHDLMPEQKYAGHGLFGEKLEATGGSEWLTADFKAGDCIVFHSHTVHAAMPNVSGHTLRLSADNRYQKRGAEFGPAATRTHHDL